MEHQGTRFVNLCSKYLDSIIHDYPFYLKFLIAVKVIQTDNHFIEGKKCRGYAYCSPYNGQPYTELWLKSLIQIICDFREYQNVFK